MTQFSRPQLPSPSIVAQNQSLVPWETPEDHNYRDLMTDVVEPIKEANPYLVWMTGKLPTSDRQMTVGWHVHKGVNPPLDDLLARLHYQHHQIEHESDNGEIELVDYWALNYRRDPTAGSRGEGAYVQAPVSLFVAARGLKDTREMRKDASDRDGIAYGWEIIRDKAKNIVYKSDGTPKKICRVKLRVYIHELLPAPDQRWGESTLGFTKWFHISVNGYLCDDLLGVLYSQYRAMRAYDARLAASGTQGVKTPYWALSNPTVPGETPRRVTSKDGQSTTIIPVRSLIPPREQDITDEYLRQHRIPKALQEDLLQGEVLLEAWNWSVEESKFIEGVKPRPTGGSLAEAPIPTTASVVVEEEQSAPVPVDPLIDTAQHNVLLMLVSQDQSKIQALCQECGVTDLAQVRTSQFRELLLKLSQR